MSEPDTLAYMTDDFALPRWNTQQPHDGLSSSAQAAQAAAQASPYAFSSGPPPQSGISSNRLQAMQQSPTGPSRQHRINQLLDEDQQYAINPAGYPPSGATLSRSASYGGAVGGASRAGRHRMQEDLEGAFNVDLISSQRQPAHNVPQHAQNSLYPPSVAYHQAPAVSTTASSVNTTSTPGSGNADAYQDTYFSTGSSHPPRRSATTHDASTSSRAARSPHRGINTVQTTLDPYSPQQNQYNPPASAYPYSPSTEHRSFPTGAYQSHSRSQSQSKAEPMTPPLPSYRSQYAVKSEAIDSTYPSGAASSSVYTPSYTMNTSSPTPSSSQNLAAARGGRGSVSQPPTPLSYGSAPPPPGPTHSPYYAQDHQAMVVEPPPKRRASGLCRVRDHRDLRPYVNSTPGGRRMDAAGTYLSVRFYFLLEPVWHIKHVLIDFSIACETTNDGHH
jgi:dual specificity protein kinase YAK1